MHTSFWKYFIAMLYSIVFVSFAEIYYVHILYSVLGWCHGKSSSTNDFKQVICLSPESLFCWNCAAQIPKNDTIVPLQWRHNGPEDVSNHQPHHCLLNRLFRRRSKKTSKLRVTGLCAAKSPVTGEFPAQMASNAENASIWWRHHVYWYPRIVIMACVNYCKLNTLFILQQNDPSN